MPPLLIHLIKAMSKKITLQDYTHITKLPVQWGDMDAARHVNNLIYLRWSESGRIAYFNAMGMNPSFSGSDTGPILAWHDCKYIFPMTFPDIAIVGVRTLEILKDRLIMESGIFSERENRIAAISKQIIVPYSYAELKKVPLPQSWKAGVEALRNAKS